MSAPTVISMKGMGLGMQMNASALIAGNLFGNPVYQCRTDKPASFNCISLIV